MKENILILIILNLFIIILSYETIGLELRTSHLDYLTSKGEKTIDELIHNALSSLLKIGDKVSLTSLLKFDTNDFNIDSSCGLEVIDNTMQDNKNWFYDYKDSTTFQKVTEFNQTHGTNTNAALAKENFGIKIFDWEEENNKYITIDLTGEKLDFILDQDTQNSKNVDGTNYNCLKIGLKLQGEEDGYYTYNFLRNLKNKNLIQTYDFFFLFNFGTKSEGKNLYNYNEVYNSNGVLILGDLPHKFLNNVFSKQYIKIYSEIGQGYTLGWNLNFEDIYYYIGNNIDENNKKHLNERKVQIDYNNYLISAPNSFLDYLEKNFFNKYEKFCFSIDLSDTPFVPDLVYYCDKSDGFSEQNLKEFPTLYFKHNNLNFTFEFNYEDLFTQKDNRYYLLMHFENVDKNTWILGNTVLKKYMFTFNLDDKTIGFYNPSYPQENDSNDEYAEQKRKIIMVVIACSVVVCMAIFIPVGIYIGRKYCHVFKKKRANELDDDYEYQKKEESVENEENSGLGLDN